MMKGALLLGMIGITRGYNNGLGATPPMGWNSWCTDGLCNLIGDDICNEKLVKSIADAFVEEGLADLGYEYVNLDDCWSATTRDADGNLQPDPKKFPNGMKVVADYVHSKNLKFGLYTCVGTKTCKGGRPGSYNNWTRDADTLTSWGVDFVKMDHCGANGAIPDVELYGNMSAALNKTGRPVLFSLCNWGEQKVYEWGVDVAQMYRIQMDHLPFWHLNGGGAGEGFGSGTLDIIEYMASLVPSRWVRQYGWLDPDFLMTLYPITMPFVESRSEFTFWALWSAPLIVSTDIRSLSAEKKEILMNKEVIAINQDPLITAGDRVSGKQGGPQVWVRSLANGDKAVVLFNSGSADVAIGVTWASLNCTSSTYAVRNLWNQTDLGHYTGEFNASSIAARDVLLLRISAV
eukprot:m.16613 g.16613  ORF g.16613 m.16613 type:complete len:404 (+) comp9060_c0_seq1:42-1253(+)